MTFRACLVLAASLLLWNPLQASAGAGMGGGGDQAMQGVSGKVVETMNSGGYTYVLVDKDGAKTWVALPQSAIAVDSVIACKPGMEMSNFKSTSLNRSFESIVFSEGLAPVGPVAAPAPAAASAPSEAITVSKAEGANAQTVSEIFEKKDALANKPVAVQGKVVKISRGIMGKNWITLVDGTGKAPDDKLLATTKQMVQIGSTLSVNGILRTNVDLGSGYKYKAVLEEAVFMP